MTLPYDVTASYLSVKLSIHLHVIKAASAHLPSHCVGPYTSIYALLRESDCVNRSTEPYKGPVLKDREHLTAWESRCPFKSQFYNWLFMTYLFFFLFFPGSCNHRHH